MSQDDKYLGFNHVTKDLELKQTSDVTWSWVDMKIQATDLSPAQLVCIGPNANQVRQTFIDAPKNMLIARPDSFYLLFIICTFSFMTKMLP